MHEAGLVLFTCLMCRSHLVWAIGCQAVWCPGCRRHITQEEFARSPTGSAVLCAATDGTGAEVKAS